MNNSKLHKTLKSYFNFYKQTVSQSSVAVKYIKKYELPQNFLSYSSGGAEEAINNSVMKDFIELGLFTDNQKEVFKNHLIVPILSMNQQFSNLVFINPKNTGEKILLNNQGLYNSKACSCYSRLTLYPTAREALENYSNRSIAFLLPPEKEDFKRILRLGVNDLDFSGDCNDMFQSLYKEVWQNTLPVNLKPLNDNSFEFKPAPNRLYLVSGLDKKARSLRCMIKFIGKETMYPKTLNIYNSNQLEKLQAEISMTGYETADIKSDLEKLISISERYEYKVQETAVLPMTEEEREEALGLAKDDDLFTRVTDAVHTLGLVGERVNIKTLFLAMVSRLMPNPLATMVLSNFGAGKSTLVEKVLSLFPDSEIIKYTSITANALYYETENKFDGKILYLAENEGGKEAGQFIRNLISSNEIIKVSSQRDPHTGRVIPQESRIKCQTAFVTTTTNVFFEEEAKSRFLILNVDESPEVTKEIISRKAFSRSIEAIGSSHDKDSLVKVFQNYQKLLKPYPVFNPWAEKISYAQADISARRNYEKVLSLIDSIVIAKQYQRQINSINGIEYLTAEIEDVQEGIALANQVLINSVHDLSATGRELLSLLKEKVVDKEFTRQEVVNISGYSMAKAYRAISELYKSEFLIKTSGRNGSLMKYKITSQSQPSSSLHILELVS